MKHLFTKKYFFDEQLIKRLYLDENKSSIDISRELKCSKHVILKFLKEYNIIPRTNKGHVVYNIIGRKFHSLTVESFKSKDSRGRHLWNCRCDCGNVVVMRSDNLRSGSQKSCGCRQFIKERLLFIGEIGSSKWKNIQKGATVRGLEFSITQQFAWDLFIKQERKCSLTNQELFFDKKIGSTASLDRIDSSKGYVVGNVQWVHKDVNKMKWAHSEEYFKKMCKLIVEFDESKKYQG